MVQEDYGGSASLQKMLFLIHDCPITDQVNDLIWQVVPKS